MSQNRRTNIYQSPFLTEYGDYRYENQLRNHALGVLHKTNVIRHNRIIEEFKRELYNDRPRLEIEQSKQIRETRRFMNQLNHHLNKSGFEFNTP